MGFGVNSYLRPNPSFITSFCLSDHQAVKIAMECYDPFFVSYGWTMEGPNISVYSQGL